MSRSSYVNDGNPIQEPSENLSRVDLAMLWQAGKRLAMAAARPAEVLRFFLLAVEESAALVRVDRAFLCLIDSEDPQLLRVMSGTGPFAEAEGEFVPIDGSFEGRVFQSSTAVRSRNLAAEADPFKLRATQRRPGPAIAVPLRIRNRAVGVLLAARESGGAPFLERDSEMMLEFGALITAGVESMRQFDGGRRARESVASWTREQQLGRWVRALEILTAARAELVFRVERSGTVEWVGSGRVGGGESFAPTLHDLLARVDAADLETVRSGLYSLLNPSGGSVLEVVCGLEVAEGRKERKVLRAWRVGETGEVVGVFAPVPTRSGEEPSESAPSAETIVRSLRHQINNPLAAVVGRAQLMIREEAVRRDPMLRQSVETILYESERINRFVQQLQNADGMSRLTEPLPGDTGPRAGERWP